MSESSAPAARGISSQFKEAFQIAALFGGALATVAAGGFVAGFAAYKVWLEIQQKDEVLRAAYVLKRDIHGSVLRNQAITELDSLIEQSKNDEAWLLEAKTFVSSLGFEKENIVVVDGTNISTPVSTPVALILVPSQGWLELGLA